MPNPWRDNYGQYSDRYTAASYVDSAGVRYPVRDGLIDFDQPIGTRAAESRRIIRCSSCGYRSYDESDFRELGSRPLCAGCWNSCQYGATLNSRGRIQCPAEHQCTNRGTVVAPNGLYYVCQDHYTTYPECSECGTRTERERAHFCPTCRTYRCGAIGIDSNGSMVCQYCRRNGATQLGYGAVPNRVMFRRSGSVRTFDTSNRERGNRYPSAPDAYPYLGLELETEMGSNRYHSAVSDVVTAWFKSGMGWATHDGSLRNGTECKTHPSTYEWLRRDDRLANACRDVIAAGAEAWPHESTGLHTHVNLAALGSPSNVYRFTWLQVTALRDQCVALAGRNGREHATWPHDGGQSPLPVIAGKAAKGSRGVALNVNTDTLELRYWKGTLSPQSVIGQCAFIDALIRFAPMFTDKDATAKSVTWDMFCEWCDSNLSRSHVRDIAGLCANRNVPFVMTVPAEREV